MIVSVDVFKLFYEHSLTFMSHIHELTAQINKMGAKNLGCWFVEAGGQGELISISTWPSIDARTKGWFEAMKDPAFMKLHTDMAKCEDTYHNYLCFPNPAVNMDGWHQSKKRLNLRMYKVDEPQGAAAKKYLEMCKYFENAGAASHIRALLHPFAFSIPVGLIVIFEEGDEGVDEALHKLYKVAGDPCHAAQMREVSKEFTVLSSRLLSPLTDEVLNAFSQLGQHAQQKKH